MAGFCVNCGAPLSGAFCNKCGARAGSPSAPSPIAPAPVQPVVTPPPFQPAVEPFQAGAQPAFQPVAPPVQGGPSFQPVAQPPAAAYAPPAARKGSILGKVLLIVGGVLVLLFVLGIAGAVYGAYWVKHKVTNFASAVTAGSSEPAKVVASGNSCQLLSTADVEKVLGVTIEKSAEIVEGSSPGCAFYTNQEAFNKLQRMATEQARKQADEVNSRPGSKPDNLPALMKETNQMEGIVKALAMTQPAEDGRVFSFTVQRDFGESSWSGMRIAESAVPGFEEVHGVGDHAMIGSFGHAFYVQKGDAMIHLDMTRVPDARNRGTALGNKIIANL
jgi:hypothetical protein